MLDVSGNFWISSTCMVNMLLRGSVGKAEILTFPKLSWNQMVPARTKGSTFLTFLLGWLNDQRAWMDLNGMVPVTIVKFSRLRKSSGATHFCQMSGLCLFETYSNFFITLMHIGKWNTWIIFLLLTSNGWARFHWIPFKPFCDNFEQARCFPPAWKSPTRWTSFLPKKIYHRHHQIKDNKENWFFFLN